MEQFDEMLSRYMKGQMSEEEEKEFRQLVSRDADLRGKAIATSRLVDAMHKVGAADDRGLIDLIRTMSRSDAEAAAARASGAGRPTKVMPLRKALLPVSIAASVLICAAVGGYKYYKYEQVSSLGSEYLACFPPAEFSRGEGDSVAARLEVLYRDIETRTDLGAAVAELEAMWRDSRGDTYSECSEYMPEIGWMLASAYLRDNEKSKALEVLDVLAREYPEGTAMGDRARELKRKIGEL